ncbi:TPA: hypothetical protein DEO28_02700 [Candidatus Dependentiae bacterium]|nr:MAG: Bifunctional phosphoglucose/phosphomannose isomerase [candidate division TM6 bacterium GW2011_GWE2_31_21]KKP53183.1 MAG: Bifunctional phosphoglucose/phosphomannose isomerase [candidate division TM6 bacterium GW2011_GWF2_33_332]HBS48001.1 hypothetical protein [Candidatus Dependentiae bacterium]HBZ73395.1 hypothetical protein [Candidatus Dependentiae bacterium]
MVEEIKLWPKKLKEGLDIAHNFHFANSTKLPKKINKIVFCGMGGSGIAGRILKSFFDKKSKIPTFAINSSVLPNFVDSETLAIVISYSGNTWETVGVLNSLVNKFVPTIVLANGGKVAEIAENKNLPFILLPQSKTPRSALGNFLGILLGLFDLMGLLDGGKQAVVAFEKIAQIYTPKFDNKSCFEDFLNYVGSDDFLQIWGLEGDCESAAYRAQTQFNENSKVQAIALSFPELTHNLVVGFSKFEKKPKILMFSTEFLPGNLEIALISTVELLKDKGISLYKPQILGDTWEEQLFYIILWADFASYYLALHRNVDAYPVKIIEELKNKYKVNGIK